MIKKIVCLSLLSISVEGFAKGKIEAEEGKFYIANADFIVYQQDNLSVTEQIYSDDTFKVLEVDQIDKTIDIDVTDAKKSKAHPESRIHMDNKIYRVPTMYSEHFEKYAVEWDRMRYGALVIPFKFYTVDGSVNSKSFTMGPYLQPWRYRTAGGVMYGPIISIGLSGISKDGEENTSLGVTAAAGVVMDIQNKFQSGIIIGTDHSGDGNWKYEDKLWISAMIGFSFAK